MCPRGAEETTTSAEIVRHEPARRKTAASGHVERHANRIGLATRPAGAFRGLITTLLLLLLLITITTTII